MSAASGVPLPLTGRTQLFAILGDPIAQAGSPGLFNAHFRAHGIEAVLVPAQVGTNVLDVVVDGLLAIGNLGGLVITVPHKLALAERADLLSPRARRVGAINALRRRADGTLEGDIFDGEGFVRSVRAAGQTLRGKRVLQIGCGGAGRAVADAIAAEAPACLGLYDLSQERATGLSERLAEAFPDPTVAPAQPDATGFDVVVNCTTLGLRPDDPLPVPAATIAPGTLVIDIVPYEDTPLLSAARAIGSPTVTGPRMLEAQVGAICTFFGLEDGGGS